MLETITTEFARKSSLSHCRGCGNKGLAPVLDYGPMPPSDGFQDAQQCEIPESLTPLELVFCEACNLLQVLETMEPQQLFGNDYLYLSSCSDSWLEHCRKNATEITSRFDLDADSLVVEVASNDGYLLQYFKQQSIPVLGIDPAPAPVRCAVEAGIETINDFFTLKLARELSTHKKADVIISNNVLAHVADIHDFISGVREMLSEDGSWIIEVPYVKNLVDGCAFDTVYHEHLCYFSVTALQHIMTRHQFYLNDIKMLQTHGGSLRVYVSSRNKQAQNVTDLLREEKLSGVHRLEYYQDFASNARSVTRQIGGLLENLASQDQRIAVYGAAAKGTILLNCLGQTARHVAYAVDRNSLKHGKWIPGVDIPIFSTDEINHQKPDYLLLLPWNLRSEILLQEQDYLRSGGKFIIPLPRPEIISGKDL